ncbi:MAG: class I SAM-dependent methyltransferase [Spirochaetes bacterium]|nr:MAG: class I SAM-dependent methyltransferase [Spirochaetota bacterium]
MNFKKHVFIFNVIASVYNWFFSGQYSRYSHVLSENIHLIQLENNDRVLDIGCGTGAFTKAWEDMGFDVTGVDSASRMVALGVKRGLKCSQGNALEGLSFPDGSFKLVVFSYVAHGLDREKRIRLYREAARLTSFKVLIHDYGTERSLGTDSIEFLEGGGYFEFIQSGMDEMREFFSRVEVYQVDRNACWYLCTP